MKVSKQVERSPADPKFEITWTTYLRDPEEDPDQFMKDVLVFWPTGARIEGVKNGIMYISTREVRDDE